MTSSAQLRNAARLRSEVHPRGWRLMEMVEGRTVYHQPSALFLRLGRHLAGVDDLRRIDRLGVHLRRYDFPFLVDQERRPSSRTHGYTLNVEHSFQSVGFDRRGVHVAQNRERDVILESERVIGEGAVDAYTQDLGVCAFQLRQTCLEGFHFLRSATCERKHKEGQHDVLLAAEVAKRDWLYALAIVVKERELRRHVSGLERERLGLLLLFLSDAGERRQNQRDREKDLAHPSIVARVLRGRASVFGSSTFSAVD